jgi:hypothetical protein
MLLVSNVISAVSPLRARDGRADELDVAGAHLVELTTRSFL